MLGYLAGPRVGSLTYNVVHIYALPLALGAAGLRAGSRLSPLVALVWIGHTETDRTFGYGLEFESEFKDTHLSTHPAPNALLGESE